MSKKDRSKDRKLRSSFPRKSIELGYYYIITDTEETEKNYFEGLKDSLPKEIKERITIKVENTRTKDLVKKALSSSKERYSDTWIVFDRDRVVDFDKIIDEARRKDINVGWSNPCFEIWLYTYFGDMPNIYESKSLCKKFSKVYKDNTKQEYKKDDKHIYKHVYEHGDEARAIDIASNRLRQYHKEGNNKPSKMCPSTTVFILVRDIKDKVVIE